MIGLPGAGKTSFYRARFADTHVHVSKDLMRNRRDRQQRQLALIDEAHAADRSVVVDNVSATAVGDVVTTGVRECSVRNGGRVGRERVPEVAIRAAAKRFQQPSAAEGF